MCIRFCFGRWELKNSTQYSVLSTQKNRLAALLGYSVQEERRAAFSTRTEPSRSRNLRMCIRSCSGSWELKSSPQYSVLSTQKNPLAALLGYSVQEEHRAAFSTRTEY
jgi:hypothetical protein